MKAIVLILAVATVSIAATSGMSLAGGPDEYVPDALAYDWSGIYMGGRVVATFTSGHVILNTGTAEVLDPGGAGFLGGGQIGVQKQFKDAVIV